MTLDCESKQWQAWFMLAQASSTQDFLTGMFVELKDAIAAGGAVCQASGRCCKFNSYGHVLYVTGLEAAWLITQAQQVPVDIHYQTQAKGVRLPVRSPAAWPDGCLYQVDGLCSVHQVRPLGCRVYFCQEGTEAWQQDIYETFQKKLKAFHESMDCPYVYAEWRGLLQSGLDYLN